MKRIVVILPFALLAMLIACGGSEEAAPAEPEAAATPATPASDRGTAEATIGSASVSIDYGRPSLGGRDMLSQLADGQVWRFGMNAATGMTTSGALMFGETKVDAGQYTLFLKKVNMDEWHLIVNSATGIWGTDYDTTKDVAAIPLTKAENADPVEQFTIGLTGQESQGVLAAEWGSLRLTADFSAE